MRYYKVLVSSPRYHKSDPLTYAYKSTLTTGTLVIVSLQNRDVLGIVVEDTAKPSFKTKEIIRTVIDTPVPKTTIELMNWLSDFYPAPSGYITSQFMPSGLLQAPRAKKNLPQNSTNSSLPVLPTLSPQQRGVLKQIADLPNQQTFLLHGDTGTGKTRLYIELAVLAQNNNKDALVMTPEISLTPQLVREFEHAFMRSVIIMHSNLTPAERRDAWLKVLYATEPVIVIGPRSALFAPFRNLGLIIVDEAHEQAYKQEQAPYYDARRVASKLAALHKARLIFGSATPNITDYYMAEAKNAPILRMTKLATNDTHANAAIELIQMRDKSEFSRHPYLSDKLLNAIQDSLNKHEQSLIFLNRRGTARLVLCQVCGWQAMCPNCDLPLTYHGDSHHLRCHTCGFKDKAPSRCPECGSADIIYKSLGTKSLVSALEKFFPNVRMQRFDTDNLKSERFEQHYAAVSRGEVDILIGTQMLAKGLDLPKLGLVGVISADTSLSFPDYTAEERTFQLLTQIVGRIGRGHRTGKAIVQTYQPESPAIQAAISKNWKDFYQAELAERKQFTFPPFAYLLKLTCTRKTVAGAQKASAELASQLRQLKLPVQIIGPTPSFYEKTAGGYRWQLVVKAKNRGSLITIIRQLPANWTYDIDPSNLL